jgi:hypothetical protein
MGQALKRCLELTDLELLGFNALLSEKKGVLVVDRSSFLVA